jgi:hypothetical protein
MFVNGSTAMEGLSGSGSGLACPDPTETDEDAFRAYARMGSSMFFTF